MKVKVIKEFVDKYSNELHKVGSKFECDEKRLKEIERAGAYVVPVPSVSKEKAEETATE